MSDYTAPLPRGDQQTDTLDDGATLPEQQPQAVEPQWISGPAPITTMAGLLAVVVAALALVRLTTDSSIDWSVAVPVVVIALGVLSVLLGVVAVSRRSRRAEHEPTE